jgi:hypothetical protein
VISSSDPNASAGQRTYNDASYVSPDERTFVEHENAPPRTDGAAPPARVPNLTQTPSVNHPTELTGPGPSTDLLHSTESFPTDVTLSNPESHSLAHDAGPGEPNTNHPVGDDTQTGQRDALGGHEENHSNSGLTEEKRDEILALDKGLRPDPSEYLSSEFIESHLRQFEHGATRFMLQDNLEAFGIGQRDGTSFVMPTDLVNSLMEATSGNPQAMERALGLPDGYLSNDDAVVRIDVPDPGQYDLRVPSGNEAGANESWIPGGFLPEGLPEAVIDGARVPEDDYVVVKMPTPEGDVN